MFTKFSQKDKQINLSSTSNQHTMPKTNDKSQKEGMKKLPEEKFSPWDEQQEQQEEDGEYELEPRGTP